MGWAKARSCNHSQASASSHAAGAHLTGARVGTAREIFLHAKMFEDALLPTYALRRWVRPRCALRDARAA